MIKLPIVIFSTPRTGSSSLGSFLFNTNDFPNGKYFNEPEITNEVPEFYEYFKQSKEFIIKFHYGNLNKYPQDVQDYLLSEATYKVSIRRRDLMKQITSLYIAIMRGRKWRFTHDEEHQFHDDIIQIDDTELEYSFKVINFYNRKLNESNVKFDAEYYYEDINLRASDFIPTPQPKNYQEIFDAVVALHHTKVDQSTS